MELSIYKKDLVNCHSFYEVLESLALIIAIKSEVQ